MWTLKGEWLLCNENDKLKIFPIFGQNYCQDMLFTVSLNDKTHRQSSYHNCFRPVTHLVVLTGKKNDVGILKHTQCKHPPREI